MGIEELLSALETSGVPVRHLKFSQEQLPPYMVYEEDEDSFIYADGTPVLKTTDYDFTLYLRADDTSTENIIDKIFVDTRTAYEKSREYNEELNIKEIIYSINI